MPASPRPSASPVETHSCVWVGSATPSVWATGASQSVTRCQNGLNWIQPPTAESTVSTPTGMSIVRGPSRPW